MVHTLITTSLFAISTHVSGCVLKPVLSNEIKMAGGGGKYDVVVVGSCMTDLVRLV